MLAKVVAECNRRKLPIPAPYDDPPYYDEKLYAIHIWAFNTLTAEREPSQQIDKQHWRVHPIGNRQIREWAELYGYHTDHDFMLELVAYVRAFDRVWVELELRRLQRSGHGKSPRVREENEGLG